MSAGVHLIRVNLSRIAGELRHPHRGLTQEERVYLVHLVRQEMERTSADDVPLIVDEEDA